MHYFDNHAITNTKEITFDFNDYNFKMKTSNNVFSKDKLDTGTKILLTTVLQQSLSGNLLDLGCGYGVIGIIINKITNLPVDMVDITDQAIILANDNIKINSLKKIKAFHRNDFDDNYKYDNIITNPPIKIGKKALYEFINDAYNRLNKNGNLYLVIRKNHGALSLIKDFEKEIGFEILTKDKGFYVLAAHKE